MQHYEVIVVGGGHAGCEAALAAARIGVQTLLITMSPDMIGAMSCNPAIGGPAAKSHLVRELDALGGEMGRVIDRSYLNIRTLNETRGPAVAALRAQADKRLYQAEMTLSIERQPNLQLRQGLVTEILVEQGRVIGVALKSGRKYFGKTVILATGTFLGGQIVMGDIKYSGGRQGEPAATELSESLKRIGLELRRFQTATPPRISRRSINFSRMEPQPLHRLEWGFSWDGLKEIREQIPCWMTATTRKTVEVIQNNLHLSPIRNGAVSGKGPRFCPSIDRKVLKFPDKTDHLIFVEPEGRSTEEMYLLGLTTAMPESVQEQIMATIPGLEHAEIIRPGYAVEYDCLVPYQFYPTLESKRVANLFTAGQLNGTSGYEEAAVQGLVAGINAARKVLGQKPLIVNRSNSYIGVLIDDLVTKGTEEPYRMMTSLAEYRIFYRLDNALHRLGEIGYQYGTVSENDWNFRRGLLNAAMELEEFYLTTKVRMDAPLWEQLKLPVPVRGYRLSELVIRPEITEESLIPFYPQITEFPLPVRQYVWNEFKLEGYLNRQRNDYNEANRLDLIEIPINFEYNRISKLSPNGLELLNQVHPLSLGQALRIPGLSEGDRALLYLYFNNSQGAAESYYGLPG